MSTVEQPAAPATRDADQSEDVLVEVEQLIAKLTAHPDGQVGAMLTALLDRVDIVHRTALARLMGAIQSMAGDAFINRLTADPAIRLLLMSYDLLAVDRRTLAEEALDAVRSHLHAHGIDVELVEVLGGVVSVRLHGAPAPSQTTYEGVRHDIERALSDGLLGFQELVIEDGAPGRAKTAEPAFLSRQSLQRAQRPVYRAVCAAADLGDGAHRSAMVDGVNVLVARVGDELFAVRNACGESPLPLDYSTLIGTQLTCSWHGCVYDIRSGRRVDRPQAPREEWLSVLPVRSRDGVIEIVVGTSALGAGSVS